MDQRACFVWMRQLLHTTVLFSKKERNACLRRFPGHVFVYQYNSLRCGRIMAIKFVSIENRWCNCIRLLRSSKIYYFSPDRDYRVSASSSSSSPTFFSFLSFTLVVVCEVGCRAIGETEAILLLASATNESIGDSKSSTYVNERLRAQYF